MRHTLRTPAEASRLRRTLVAELRAQGFNGEADDAGVMASELIANALEHAGSAAIISVDVAGDQARVAVHDDSSELPVVRPVDPHRVGGNGMRVVEAFSHRWGVDVEPSGKTVWFTVVRPAR